MTQPRAVIYARYSSDLQREASIEDQVRECQRFAQQMNLRVVAVFSDAAVSGSIEARSGLQALLSLGQSGAVDVVVAEALDRVSRDQEHIARIFKRLTFFQVKLTTIAEGDISELHVGLKGTMNALFLKDLAEKIRRGQKGRALSKRSPGGLPYGYDVVRQFGPDGRPDRGLRKVNEHQAAVVKKNLRRLRKRHVCKADRKTTQFGGSAIAARRSLERELNHGQQSKERWHSMERDVSRASPL